MSVPPINLNAIRSFYIEALNFDLSDLKNENHPFYKNYQLLLTLNQESEQFNYILFHNLFGPIEYLEELKKISSKKYKIWKNRLIKNTNNVGFYGDLFELYITWSLVKKNVDFRSIDSPDYEINFYNSKIFIECTSAQFDFKKNPTEKNEILLKITDSLHKKMELEYATTSTCLFVDITNLCYHAKSLNSPITQKELTTSLINASQKIFNFQSSNTFGAVMFFFFNTFKDSNGQIYYGCNSYNILENVDANENLITFLKNNNIDIPNKQSLEFPKFNHDI